MVAGEQLMLVDGQPQAIVVEQQVAYQVSAEQAGRVFYMQEEMQDGGRKEGVDAPIVLNHHMQKVGAQAVGRPQGRLLGAIQQIRQSLQVGAWLLWCESLPVRKFSGLFVAAFKFLFVA